MKVFDEKIKREVYEMYAKNIGTVKISKQVHTSPQKIKEILFGLGVDIHDPNKVIGKRIKPKGYWNIKENNERAASECRNRAEFCRKYIIAYYAAKNFGWIFEYDKKYFNGDIKFVSFDDPVHVVYVYEVSETHAAYIGRTLDLQRRDLCHRNKTQNDTLFRYCQEKGVDVPRVKVLEEGLVAVQSQEREDYWKRRYRDMGWDIINKASTGIGSGSLGSMPRKWNHETCKEVAELCVSREDLKKRYVGAYNVARKNGWLKEFFPNIMKREDGCFNTLEKCKEAATGFRTIMEIRRNYPFLYRRISKNKWTEEIRQYLNTIHRENT